jgi:myosin-5
VCASNVFRQSPKANLIPGGGPHSGAGKTVSAKYILRYFASVEDPTHSPTTPSWPRQRSKLDETGMSETEKQILASNPIMEAFGNAKTTRNDNSSRFGKYIEVSILLENISRLLKLTVHHTFVSQVNFNKRHEIVGAKIRTYLLERSRLVYQPEIERNYHIFYQLLAGVLDTERKQLHLEAPPSSFAYLSGGGPKSVTISGVDDAHEFRETQKALSTVGLPTDEQKDIWKILAGLLHLGNVKIDQRGTGTRGESFIDSSDQALGFATDLLGINKSDFRKWTMKKKLATRGESIETNLSAAQAMVVRDSVAKYIYSCLFDVSHRLCLAKLKPCS